MTYPMCASQPPKALYEYIRVYSTHVVSGRLVRGVTVGLPSSLLPM